MWESSYSVPLNIVNENCLKVSLLNTRSLRSHAQYIAKDINLIENYVFCVTEIQISQENNVPDIKQQSGIYEVHLNLEGDRYKNIGFCLSKRMEINKHEKFPGVSILKTIKSNFFKNIITILLLYRSLNSSLTIFYNRVDLFLLTCEIFDLVLRDFKINALANGAKLRNIYSLNIN